MNAGSFYSEDELPQLGLGAFGQRVRISRRASFYNPAAIRLGDNVRIDDFAILSGGQGITIGSHVHLGAYTALYGGGRITMDDFTGLSPRSTIFSETDDVSGASLTNPTIPRRYKPTLHTAPVRLRCHSAMGANSTIMPGVELGEGAVVGAHSLAMKSCLPWSIYFGVPAQRLKARSQKLLESTEQFLVDFAAGKA